MNYTNLLNGESDIVDLNQVYPIDEGIVNLETNCTPVSKNTHQRQENFSADEDKLLVSAWLNIGLDLVTGSDQKVGQFWKIITNYFQKTKTWPNERSEKSLTSRWTKINKEVSMFCGHYAAIDRLRRSGTTEHEKVAEAKVKFKEIEKHAFVLDHCWVILRSEQKWMDESKRVDDKSTKRKLKTSNKNTKSLNVDEDSVDVQELSKEERPIGRKAAKEVIKKAKIKEQNGGNQETSKSLQLLEELKAKRMDYEHKRNDQFELLLAAEQKQIALKEKELEIQTRNKDAEQNQTALRVKELEIQSWIKEAEIMALDTSVMPEVQAKYFTILQKEILAKRSHNCDP